MVPYVVVPWFGANPARAKEADVPAIGCRSLPARGAVEPPVGEQIVVGKLLRGEQTGDR